MSLRCMTREPAKRMLVFFNCDETTSVLGTNKVKKVLNGNRLEKGASVLVAYGKDEFEAQVVKLHDDPSVLRQAEIEFLSKRFDSAHGELADKENNPKRQKLSPDKTKVDETKVDKHKGSKAGKQPKTMSKKIISIDAEALPSAESQPPTQKPKPENKPGSLTFLNVEEQLKVQKILSEYEKGDGKEVGVQTEQNVVQPHHCNSQNAVSTKLDLLEQKVNTIISLLTTTAESAKKLEEQEELFYCDELFVIGNDSLEEEQILFGSIALTVGPAAKQTPPAAKQTPPAAKQTPPAAKQTPPAAEQTPPAAEQTPPTAELPVSGQCSGKTFSVFPLAPPQTTTCASIASLVHTIPSGVFEETFKKSSSIANYAKNLVFSLFSKEELIDSNCTGAYQKKTLEKDYRMTLITDATFKKYSVDNKKKSWSLCRKAIDSAIRKLRFQC